MSKNWTPQQRQAIQARDKTILVSAAAGSGKTATLTERIVRKLTDEQNPSNIARMLIVTFTRLSAADLKRKISDAISEELVKNPTSKYLSKQLVLLESAHICTIDSFYLDIVRNNFQRLGLPSNFRLADEGEMALLRKEIMDGIIEKHYDNADENSDAFLSFVENFTSAKQSDTLSDIFLALENKLCSKEEGTSAILLLANELYKDAECDFFNSRHGKIIHSYIQSGAQDYLRLFEHCCNVISNNEQAAEAYLATFAYEKDFWVRMTNVLNTGKYSDVREVTSSFTKQKLKSLKKAYQTDEIIACKALRDEACSFIKSIKEKFLSFDEEQIKDIAIKTGDILTSLHNIITEFEEAALAEKIKRKAFDFDDIRRFAYQLLTDENGNPSDIALSYREQFDEIYIDEYQDVDEMQDRIFTLIAKENNRFMVGDIKQSIYSFRGADTDVFAKYKKMFPAFDVSNNSNNALIFMSNNFRCDENIIHFTNLIFSFLFGYCGKSIEYSEEDNLIFSKVEEGRTLPSPTVNITVITADEKARDGDEDYETATDNDEDDENADINAESLWIAQEINRLIKHEKKADGTPIEPKDIAILMRATTPASNIAKALSLYGIPCSDNSKYDLFETPDVLLTLSLLSCIDNPHRDIPLAAALYSPLFAYTMDDLIAIRSAADTSMSLFEALCAYCGDDKSIIAKNEYFTGKLTSYRQRAASLSIDKLLNFIYRDLSMNSFENANSQNLTRLYEMARRFEAGSFKGLSNFISYINELIENQKVPSLTYEDADTNAVQMITAHKSKGLEFPVCFICNTQSRFNNEDAKSNLLYHSRAGVALRLAYENGMARLNTPLREAVALEIANAQFEEEMRILYVALTRARERLYITAHTRSRLEKLEEKAFLTKEFASDFRVRKSKNWLAMVLSAIHPLEDGISYTFTAIEKDGVSISPYKDDYLPEEIVPKDVISERDIDIIKERLEFKYPHAHLNKLPAKLSVSKLTPTVLDDIDEDAATLESFDEAKILEIEEFFESRSRTTSADRGTATHLFLQFCDFENAEKNGVENELSRLVENKFIAHWVAELVNKKQIAKFFESKFYATLKNAQKSFREQRFNILLPASHFTQDNKFKEDVEQEEILVQGVIDLFFKAENGDIILCDYKTDYLTLEELQNEALVIEKMKQRHGRQLEYYAMAIEQLVGTRPNKILIYSLPLGEAVEIKL